MTFDMKQCKPGDKLITVHGTVLEYVRYDPALAYPYIIRYPNGASGSRLVNGQVFGKNRLPTDEDVIGFFVGNDQ